MHACSCLENFRYVRIDIPSRGPLLLLLLRSRWSRRLDRDQQLNPLG